MGPSHTGFPPVGAHITPSLPPSSIDREAKGQQALSRRNMLQRAVALLLQRLLGKFVSFDSSMLRLSLWQGDLSFKDVQLRLSYGEGSIGELSLNIPWRSLWTQPVVIKAQRIRVFLHKAAKTGENGVPVDDVVEDEADGPTDRTYLSRLVSHIIANVQVELTDVQVRYDCALDSTAKRPGSASLEIASISLINTNAQWELEFTPQSNSIMESRKLLRAEGICAYVEYDDTDARGSTSDQEPTRARRYLLHGWYGNIKATLSYQSSISAFPDVELAVEVGCQPEQASKLECCYCDESDAWSTQAIALASEQPRIHLAEEHIDVFYAILMEVKAPYEEFERLSELSQRQTSRPDGFVTVLSYAKQWLLSDCLDGIVTDSGTTSNNYGDSDDDDDEFEDAITPPTLVIRASLDQGLGFVVYSRGYEVSPHTDKRRMWIWSMGRTTGCIKQSCVEDEIQVSVQSLVVQEVADNTISSYRLFSTSPGGSLDDTQPLVLFSCVVPAYESRLVGHQPVMSIALEQNAVIALKDETLVAWMTLFAPVYQWWNQWNLMHPSKAVLMNDDRIAPISQMTVDVGNVSLLFALHGQLCFGASVGGLHVRTQEMGSDSVVSKFQFGQVRVFSSSDSLQIMMANIAMPHLPPSCHAIVVVDDMSLTKSSDSRIQWVTDKYICQHADDKQSSSVEEAAMYNYDVELPQLQVHLDLSEVEALAWVVGKWTFFLPDTRVDVVPLSVRRKCYNKWNISIPNVKCMIVDNRQESKDAEFRDLELSSSDFRMSFTNCTSSHQQRLTVGSLIVKDNDRILLHVVGNTRLSIPALRLSRTTRNVSNVIARRSIEELDLMLYQVEVCLYLPSFVALHRWFNGCAALSELGYVIGTSLGYDMDEYRRNLASLQVKAGAARHLDTTVDAQIQLSVARSCRVVILHKEPNASIRGFQDSPVEVAALECTGVGIGITSDGKNQTQVVKGTVRNLQVMDLTFPRNTPPGTDGMPNRYFISSNQTAPDGSVDANLRNTVDFTISVAADESKRVRIRLDSLHAAYLHRVYKQFHHYVLDHVSVAFSSPVGDLSAKSEEAAKALSAFGIDTGLLPTSLEETLLVYRSIMVPDSNAETSAPAGSMVQYELIANDLVFSLPRSSFSTDSIILRCTNARLWSSDVDPEMSNFLLTGNFEHEGRASQTLNVSDYARAQQNRRLELRNLRRLVKNQRSRMLNNRSQLLIDLNNATQQAQNYLHEGFEALPAAEEAVRIIHNKIITLEKQLEQLDQYVKVVDDAIEDAKADAEVLGNGRDSMHLMINSPVIREKTQATITTEVIERIRTEVMGMSQHLIAPLFGADDAEFHDARTITTASEHDLSRSAMSLFEFELVDMSGATSHSTSPLFNHALLTGRIESVPESLPDGAVSSYFNIDLGLNEFSVGTHANQYQTLLGMIFENFKEVSSAVDEDTYPLCGSCNGHHYEDESCHAIWLKIPVKVMDGALRVFKNDHPLGDLLMEQFDLTFTLRTDDSLELSASAASLSLIDARPDRCESAMNILRPLVGEGLQVEYKQVADWTDSRYDLTLRNTSCLVVYPVLRQLASFFVTPVVSEGAFYDFGVGFMGPTPPDWKKMEFHMDSHGCSFALLEDFAKVDSRALVILSSIEIGYSTCQKCDDMLDMRKCHFSFDQHGIFFSQLPDLQVDVSFPLANSFMLVFDHLIEGTVKLYRRNSFVLGPVEARFSVQDSLLFLNIINNYLATASGKSRKKNAKVASRAVRAPISQLSLEDGQTASSGSAASRQQSTAWHSGAPVYAVDKLLGDVGEVRFVMVNNSLGIPVADFQLSEIVCEFIQDEEYSVVIGAILAMNYFNNSIYRWEPLVEPFLLQVRLHRTLEENSRVEVFANLPNTVNLNLTPAMAHLLSSDALTQADFVTTGSKSTAPFWIVNRTGTDIKFSFRRGMGSVIQQVVPNNVQVAVDCREQGDMRSFDSASADRFLRSSDKHALTVNHTLSVWLNDNKWVSANPVVVDVVGHVSVPLREALVPYGDDPANPDEDVTPPILVAEITIQPDGSKLISLHSQVVLQNRTSIPLMVWAFSPREGGTIREWVVEREEICHVPIELIHPQSKISIRPSPYVQYAPLTSSLEELGDEVRAAKSSNTKRFVRSGNCICNFEAFVSLDDSKKLEQSQASSAYQFSTSTLAGYVVQDLPTWKCTYDVEAYYLMRATFSSADDMNGADENAEMPAINEDEATENVDEEFQNVFGERSQKRRIPHPLSEVNNELEEARNASQRRGLYEATNSSLYHLSVSPFLTLHNRLAAAVAYRLLNQSLQLIGEGVLAVGSVLPLFQIDPAAPLFISFRLENYNWSVPKLIVNPKVPAYALPYKESIEPVELFGREFHRDIPGEQGSVPNLQLQVKLSGRDVIVFCSVWIVNHSGLDLEYCNSSSTSSRRLESVLRYIHSSSSQETVDQSMIFSTRNMSFHNDVARDIVMTRLQKVKASVNPVAVIVVVQDAREIYNAQYFGSQSPYVRVSLYVLKNVQDRFSDKPEMQIYFSATTKPSPSGGTNPTWDSKLQNTILMRLPQDTRYHDKARIIIEVRNVRYGMDTCLGVTAIKLETILNNRDHAAGFNWYKLLKRKSKDKKSGQTNVHRGDIRVSFAVGTKQELQSELDAGMLDTPESQRSSSLHNDVRPSMFSPPSGGEESNDLEDAVSINSRDAKSLPATGAIRSMQRLQTPSNVSTLPVTVADAARRGRQAYALHELTSTRAQADTMALEPMSTRGMATTRPTPPKPGQGGKVHHVQVYLPQNRFAFVVVEVTPGMLMSEVFDVVCATCGYQDLLDPDDFDFYELLLPRFVSLRSAGRPEGERWYGPRVPMETKIEKRGRQHGLHLCHKLVMSTIRLYDENSTASTHHMTPRSLLSTSQRTNPAQNRPVAWGEVLLYGSGGRNWDVLRVRSPSSPWSEVIRLNRNAMGNAGVAQVVTLTNEVNSDASELKKGNQEVALWSSFGSGRFSETIVATLVPRYILINRTADTIKYRQLHAPQTFQLSPNELVPFHWPSATVDKLLEVTLVHGYTWSGSFRIHSLGTTYLKLRDSNDASRIYILQCQIEMIGGSIALIFREESKRFPPYRIDNMTSFRIQLKQTGWGSDADYDELPPRSSCAYSWDVLTGHEKHSYSSSQDPTFPSQSTISNRTLQVRFMRITSSTGLDSDKDAVETREYHLDEMTTHRRIQLQRSLPSQLFIKPDHKGYLMKKDNLLKWAKKYFRLYEHMLYYFASEQDQELLGVIDLRAGSDVPGAGGVAIFEKTNDVVGKSGFTSLNGFVSTISGTIFGTGSRKEEAPDTTSDDDDDDDVDDRSSELVQLAVSMTASNVLGERSEEFASKLIETGDLKKIMLARTGFFVNGHDLVDFLLLEKHVHREQEALATADEMMQVQVIQPVVFGHESEAKKALMRFQYSKIVWYSVNSIMLADDTESLYEETPHNAMSTRSVAMSTRSTMSTRSMSRTGSVSMPRILPRSTQFSIVTTTKNYELKAKSTKEAGVWLRRLRKATRAHNNQDHENGDDDQNARTRSQPSIAPAIHNAKTYVHVRVRADGPTKVLELYEGGEEEADERDMKNELSSLASVSSGSPTASETSTNAFESLTNGVSIHLRLDGFGISCINEIPTELVYIYLGGINIHYSRVNAKMRLKVTLDDVQVDNQSSEATFPKLLCPRMTDDADLGDQTHVHGDDDEGDSLPGDRLEERSPRGGGLVANQNLFSCADCRYRQANIASVHFCCTWSNEQGSTDYFEHCSFWMYPIVMQLDEELMVAARGFMNEMTQSWGKHQTQNRGGEIRMKSVPIEIMTEAVAEFKENTSTEDLNPLQSLETTTASSTAEVRKVYFALLHIHPIELDITYRSDVFQATTTLRLRETASFKSGPHRGDDMKRTASMPSSSSGLTMFDFDNNTSAEEGDKASATWAIPSLAMRVPDLDNAPVRLNALMIEHAFGTSGDLTRRVTKYYTRQMWKQLHKILGSFDFLGNPVGFLDHIGTGVRDFVYEPLDGLRVGGKGFSKGLAKGTASLVSNTLDGTFDAASKISGTFGQGLANLSLDDRYQQVRARARRRHVRGIKEGLIQGSKELSFGVYEGVTGLVLGPMRGARENGAVGFVKGTFTGIIGLPVKPVAGIFDFASRASQGVRNRSRKYGKSMRRVRRPRVFGRYNELRVYKEADTIAYDLLKKTGGNKLYGEKIVFYHEVVQSVAASELTQEARERRKNDTLKDRTASLRRSLQENEQRDRESSESEDGRRKLLYEVTFRQRKLGLELETDFYCENVTIKSFEEALRLQVTVETKLKEGQEVLQEGDVLVRIGGVDVRGIGFHETLAMLRGTSRPIRLQFESAEEHFSVPESTRSKATPRLALADEQASKLRVQLTHWLIVTEERALYINVGSLSNPIVEWMTPLRYVYRIEWVRGAKICLHLSVGVDSLPTGPRMRPSLKALDGQERDMNVFLDVMWLSFGSTTAEEQELWPSDTSLNGYLLKKGGFSTVRRWFVLSRNCLYFFSSRKELRGIIPLGSVRLQADAGDTYSIRITNAVPHEPLVTLQIDNGQVIQRAQSEVVLIAPNAQDFEMWQSSLAHAAGRGLRHSRGTRFYVPNDASRLEIGCRDTPDFVVAPLVEALRKAVKVFNTKLTAS
ncbi:hypothetical protein Poli38472_000888 [Pythium oligandrum]|uniref:Uncharacterized protein n=1 Tax=Pythium oligandrum TaxID=41045 RepID=A0A8K1CCI9_PYTOL|nr:hypothetical protein Poli38472_000888 [Pythium oligandrum]|eukprot:TMW60846.1 hypothetical protein Poli38472_000888 [Pythium oligandrum]